MILYVKLPDSVLRSFNYQLQGIRFLQVYAPYPSRLTKLIMIKSFLGRLSPCDSPLSKKKKKKDRAEIFLFRVQRIYLLLI